MNYLKTAFDETTTPQSEPLPGSTQVPNSAGGFSWKVDKWVQLDRFLILGSEGGTYYISERKLTRDNAKNVESCIKEDGIRTVNRIVEISHAGRAAKNDPALFALALCAAIGSTETKQAALAALTKVARIGTHLFHFADYVQTFRGWGRGLRDAVGNWYTSKDPEKLAYQVIKYQARDGWSHRDLLRLTHVHPKRSGALPTILKYIVKGWEELTPTQKKLEALAQIKAFETAKGYTAEKDAKKLCKLIREHDLPRECVPTEALTNAAIWEALLEKMPYTAMVRNLANMTRCGLLATNSDGTKAVIEKLGDQEAMHRSRIHPIQVLAALKTYEAGHGLRGKNTWEPVKAILPTLEDAFYVAFDNVPRTGKRFFIGQDISGSMTSGDVCGVPGLTPALASAALAMCTVRVEPFLAYYGFGTHLEELGITAKQDLPTVLRKISNKNFGGTDCSLPMQFALQKQIPVDVFSVYTDSETWAGDRHPAKALNEYRKKTGIPAKLVVIGMVSNGFTIADPDDAGMLDVVGFDTATPAVIADFASDGAARSAAQED